MKFNKIAWLIQTNLLREDQIKAVWEAAVRHGCEVHEAIVIPFQDELNLELPEFSEDTLVIPYGSTTLIKKNPRYSWNGVFFDENVFRAEVWNANRTDMLNSDGSIMTVREAIAWANNQEPESDWFIRPVKDLKEFSGTVTTAAEISRWMSSVDSGNFSFTEDTIVSIAQPKKLIMEWRFFVVGGKVVDGSSYRINNQLKALRVSDPSIMADAQALADVWLPHETCVMDIALLDDGTPKVVEFNCFNGSGFYKNDVDTIVKAVVDYYT